MGGLIAWIAAHWGWVSVWIVMVLIIQGRT